ncbi:MAG TPA: hypothetical protein VHD32_15795 [Candidatus Didemnitutus sp.]|jgi:hypothetical protein|nr:hypothetical protein [Candidatus Didemnitutus sp.]
MKPDRIDELLAAYANQPLPSSREPSADRIWRAINTRRRQSWWSRVFPVIDWRELFAEPRLAVAAVAFAIMIGVVPAMAVNRAENERRLARQSIHFEVFSADAGSLGSVFARPVAMVTPGRR